MTRRILTSAVLAGAGAGVVAAVLELVFVQPVLLHAELYEAGKLAHAGGAAAAEHADSGGLDLSRSFLTVIFTMLIYTGYALILVPAMALAERFGTPLTARGGLVWGLAGFAAVQLAPAFSLAPEVPGTAAAELTSRQIWWAATVAMAAAGLGLLAFGRGLPAWAAAAVLLLAPHLVGAPEPEALSNRVPPELAALFAARALAVGAVSWMLVGWFAGALWGYRDETAEIAGNA